MKEQNQINDGEGFTLNGKRIQWDGAYYYISFVYSNKYGLIAGDDIFSDHQHLYEDFARMMILRDLPNNDPDRVASFFTDYEDEIKFIYTGEDDEEQWEDLCAGFTGYGLKPSSFDDIPQFKNFILPIIERYFEAIDEIRRTGIDGRLFLVDENTAVLTFWWQECSVSPDDILKIISALKDKYPSLNDADFYVALAHKVVPLEKFTGDFVASDEDVEQIEKQKEIHLMNYRDKRRVLNPYLTDRTRHQGQRLQMSNGDEMTQAEYNSYLRQESIRRMVKRVIVEYLNLKTKLVIR